MTRKRIVIGHLLPKKRKRRSEPPGQIAVWWNNQSVYTQSGITVALVIFMVLLAIVLRGH